MIGIGPRQRDVLYAPDHTDDSCRLVMHDPVFTGDTLLIRGTGRTDFRNGAPDASYDGIMNKLPKPPDETLVYPAHDYNAWMTGTIGGERRPNPGTHVRTADEYAEIMDNIRLPDRRLMDVVIAANQTRGQVQ